MNILKKSGYDNASSLGALNQDEHIHEIEEYITENHLEWVKEDNAYKNITNIFRFLPGHKIFLKILPNKVKDFQCHFSKKNKKTSANSIQVSPNNNLDNNNVAYEETIEILNYDELQELKNKLQAQRRFIITSRICGPAEFKLSCHPNRATER